ncbi:MAG: hypothetical protein ACRD6X_06360 [Pyrinomonadaceae bacterium]
MNYGTLDNIITLKPLVNPKNIKKAKNLNSEIQQKQHPNLRSDAESHQRSQNAKLFIGVRRFVCIPFAFAGAVVEVEFVVVVELPFADMFVVLVEFVVVDVFAVFTVPVVFVVFALLALVAVSAFPDAFSQFC